MTYKQANVSERTFHGDARRPYLLPNGKIEMRALSWCRCGEGERRGPAGGVCRCGGAIPEAQGTKPTKEEAP